MANADDNGFCRGIEFVLATMRSLHRGRKLFGERMKIYLCPECGSRKPWKHFLAHSVPHACPSCGAMLALLYPPSPVFLLLWGLLLVNIICSVVLDFTSRRATPLSKASDLGWTTLLIAALALSRGCWVKDTSHLTPDEICAKLRAAEALIRQGVSGGDAAQQIDVPYHVFRRWRKQYGDLSDSSTLKAP